MTACIRFEQRHAIARVTISYPKRFNAMSRAMWRELKAVFEEIGDNPDLRCVLVSGEGMHFCAGGDISEYADFRFQEATLRAFHEQEVWGALSAMLACDVPLVAQIAGNCMGAGIEIACCCDIRVAGASARFGAPIARLGFPMAPRETALVLREIGAVSARQMLFEAALLDASEMLQRGFLTRVVPDEDLATQARATVRRVAELAPRAARMNKQTLRLLQDASILPSDGVDEDRLMDAPLAAFLESVYAYADSDEQREGITAFLQKRPPIF